MPQAPHPITTIRRQARESATPNVLMEGCFALAPRVLPYSRRASRLLERIGLERPSLKLSGLLAELSAAGHKGIPVALVDKLADALGEMLAGRAPRRAQQKLAPPLLRLVAALDDLERRTIASGSTSRTSPSDAIDVGPRPCVARLTLDEHPPAFFYAEGRGLDAVPGGLVVALAPLAKNEPLVFVPMRGPMLDVPSRLYAIERMRDVVFEPIADEGARLVTMLATGAVVRLALLPGGGLRITLRDPSLAEQIGLGGGIDRVAPVGVEEEPGRWLVLHPERARDVVAALALRDDVTIAWSSAERFDTKRASAHQLKVRLGEKRDWLGAEGGVSIDDDIALTLGDLLTALREGRRYVIAQGKTLIALDEALADALAPLTMSATLHAPALVDLAKAGARIEGAAWNEMRADVERARSVDGTPPSSLVAELRPYQRDGLRFLRRLDAWGIGGVLADDMGLGKTVQAIAWLLDRHGSGDAPALVVAPTSVTFNWHDELARFAPSLRVVRYEGAKRAARLHNLTRTDVVVTSYAIVQRDAALLARTTWGALILDEAQHVKNASTRRAKGVRAIAAHRRVALTGTPLENHTGELWAIFDAVAPGLFGSWTEFKARFATPIEKEADVRRRRTLAKAIAPFVLRRKKRDVAPELPPRTEVVRYLPLEMSERRAYERVRQALLVDLLRASDDDRKLEAPERRVKLLAAITKLRLVACHESYASDVVLPPEQVVPGTKQRTLVELLVSLRETGERALVFSQFVRHLEIARAAATTAGVTSLQLDGSTPAEHRRALVERFQAGEVDAFFLSLKAGGTGLNLVRASYVIHLDPWWNPAVEDQAADRAHRIGQTQPVTVVRLVAEDTLEEQILDLHEHKRALIEGVLEGTAAAGTLDTDELLDIVRHTRRSAREEDRAQELADPALGE